MKLIKFMIISVMVVGMSGIVSGTVVFDETFDTDLSAWNVLDTAPSGSASVSLDGSGKLVISLTNTPQWNNFGVGSKVGYAVPAGGMLVADFYGENFGGAGHHYPYAAVSSQASSGQFMGYMGTYAAEKGADAYYGDWAQSTNTGYSDLAGGNLLPPVVQHSILTVDATGEVNWYIETDFWENLVSPTPLYTEPGLFTAGQLDYGLYINLCAARYTSWYSGENTEKWDGVRVTTIPEPVSLVLFAIAGSTMLFRKKK